MRLMFWSARESGAFARSPSFEGYFTRFLGHFVSVYEESAPLFVRDSSRWSTHPANIAAYEAAGFKMGHEVSLRTLARPCSDFDKRGLGTSLYLSCPASRACPMSTRQHPGLGEKPAREGKGRDDKPPP